MISGLEKIEEGKIWAGKDKSLNHKDLMDMSYFVFQDSDYQLFSEEIDTESYKHITPDEREKIRLAFVRCFFFYNAQKKVPSINNRLKNIL